MFNAVMKHATSNVRATVRNDLLVHQLRHRVSFATGQLLCLLRPSNSMDLPRPVMAFGNSFLHHSPKVRAVGKPHVRSSEFWSFTTW